MPLRFIGLCFQKDSNCINARIKNEDLNKLEKWASDDVISIQMSLAAQNEVSVGSSQRSSKSTQYIYNIDKYRLLSDKSVIKEIEKIVFEGQIQSSNEIFDLEILFDNHKDLDDPILLTMDGEKGKERGILTHKDELEKLGIRVMHPKEAVVLIQKKILERDEYARLVAKRPGEVLPDWVGQD